MIYLLKYAFGLSSDAGARCINITNSDSDYQKGSDGEEGILCACEIGAVTLLKLKRRIISIQTTKLPKSIRTGQILIDVNQSIKD